MRRRNTKISSNVPNPATVALVAAAQLPRGGTRLKKMGTAGEEGRLGIVHGEENGENIGRGWGII